MKILHVCLAGSYTENMTYQDNMLPEQNVKDGHDVLVISDCTCYKDGKVISVPTEDRLLSTGIRLVRLEYDFTIPKFVGSKIRKTRLLNPIIEEYSPDIIFFHNCCGWELLTVARYKLKFPAVKLFLDSHADFHNSARGFFSRNVLHRLFYRQIVRRVYPHIDTIFYISLDSKDFLNKLYGLPDEKLEFYPLGGTIFEEEIRNSTRKRIRDILNLSSGDVLFMHSGKLDSLKRTKELLHAFSSVQNHSFKMVIIGSMPDDMEQVLLPLIENDDRIMFLGWKKSNELFEYLCSCDLYLQPGTQSATMQNAICCGAPVMLYPYRSYEPFLRGNGWFVKDEEDMKNVFEEIGKDPTILKEMSSKSYAIAHELLDYRKLASRLYIDALPMK